MSGAVVWITGVPASGKTTLARGLVAELQRRGVVTLWLDSDDLRGVIPADYSESGRDAFYGALGHIARLGAEGGSLVIVSATASRRRYRDQARAQVMRFFEIYLRCDPAALRGERDIKGLYARADAGELDALPGASAPFEPPEDAQLTLDTEALDARAVLAQATRWLELEVLPTCQGGSRHGS